MLEFVQFSSQIMPKVMGVITIAEKSPSRNTEMLVDTLLKSDLSIDAKINYVLQNTTSLLKTVGKIMLGTLAVMD